MKIEDEYLPDLVAALEDVLAILKATGEIEDELADGLQAIASPRSKKKRA